MNTDANTIFETKSTEKLTDLLATYCDEHALPHMDALELFHELWAVIEAGQEQNRDTFIQYIEHTKWLVMFIAQWEAVQNQEDTKAECKRNGHRDTGRGVCADCGAFV